MFFRGTRTNYWSCTDFADWLRGTKKPGSASGKGWRLWREKAKKAHPFRYWLADKGLDKMQDVVLFPADAIHAGKCYIRNRFIDKTNALTAHRKHIKPGDYSNVSYRMLPCMFDTLVDFVEMEKAWMMKISDPDKYKLPWWQKIKAIRLNLKPDKKLGMEHLEWEAALTYTENGVEKPTPQALAAREIIDLYIWWTEVYSNRPDPMDASGWSAYCELHRKSGYDLFDDTPITPEMEEMKDAAHKSSSELEELYENEDTEMLIRLVKVRRSLWT